MEHLKVKITTKIEKYLLVALSVICVFVYNIFLANFVVFSFNIRSIKDDKIEIFLKENFNKLYEQSKCSIFHKVKIYSKITKFLFFLWLNNSKKDILKENDKIHNTVINQKQKLTI